MFYSGSDHQTNGVGIIMKQCMAESVMGCWTISDRVMVIKLKGAPVNLNVIQTYVPTSVSTKKELEEFYYQLDLALSACKPTELQVVMGDFNAKIGKGSQHPTAVPHELGERNEYGDSLVEWCKENNLTILNTRFESHERRLYTWKSPGDQTRNQIDFIITNRSFRNSIKSRKTYPGAECNSDHNLLMQSWSASLKIWRSQKEILVSTHGY